ncbi:monofunctional biosynthetic peptidoglycan transglycosylase [Hoylesella buccalis]|uniref:monofunctional biosynthetic peptidoglycan transglycosylase n=1 Tax=Hoylesella buccalis TaxID=28127 RepID=UPI001D091DEB|nr:monofunctional biosynthetic peptidoglycan transglycosylase [Hoylesella buccalis]MCB6900948.1 monofunctional biosynthetic peptidoglycan transglycosylase [Hoylesella buccalis]UEA62612.1 monofunctional biosynthetic peptidoglycan transglycosylase [Hoylesella buccalis]UWP50102.1 monofunctional biosynthetic peptidoglycan transglycosylase [Hoylesella buccalis ATCC 35310]
MKKIASFFRWAIVLFLATSILTVVAYRFIPVYITPLMVIRCFEKGELKMHHHWVAMDDISRHMPVAVMASEDQRFLLHHGFDYNAIEKAAVHNIKNKTGKKRGASTITQQTAKNVFLWPGRSWVRKGFEVYFTALIELIWSKQRIMEVYLNSIEMGDMIYGVDAVARYHFGKTASDLSRSECALIAATLPNPIRFSSKAPSGYVRLRQRKIEHEMKFIPSFPKEGEDIDPNTTKGGIYHKKR